MKFLRFPALAMMLVFLVLLPAQNARGVRLVPGTVPKNPPLQPFPENNAGPNLQNNIQNGNPASPVIPPATVEPLPNQTSSGTSAAPSQSSSPTTPPAKKTSAAQAGTWIWLVSSALLLALGGAGYYRRRQKK